MTHAELTAMGHGSRFLRVQARASRDAAASRAASGLSQTQAKARKDPHHEAPGASIAHRGSASDHEDGCLGGLAWLILKDVQYMYM